ncbi:MAG: D-alanyl-D-alanine carboxypeptidase [Ruminococcaceae bacterium]|nr:D-alanyl-D-alanine carboxypeptidase [Oscillospiraceae bacterium]
MKKTLSVLLITIIFLLSGTSVFAKNDTNSKAESNNLFGDVAAKSAVLMEAETGEVIYSKNESEAYSPASVTKIMTLLLSAEALDTGSFNLDEKVKISSYAASMGGSQVFLEEGEEICVEELIKCAVIASANDAAVALAELVSGSEEAFVNKMNRRAKELGMNSTNFENVTGLDDTTENHVTSALDIAIMSRELIKHDIILKYSSLWQDTIRGGEFTLTNTNRLVRFYDGCNGLKTGSTDKAGYCVSATAKRGDMQLIAVIMGAETRDIRNEIARKMLDFGFANYTLYKESEAALESVPVTFGKKDSCTLYEGGFKCLVKKADFSKIEKGYSIPEKLRAEVTAYNHVGRVEYFLDGKKIGEAPIYTKESIEKIGFLGVWKKVIEGIFICEK